MGQTADELAAECEHGVRSMSPVGNGWVATPTVGRSRCTSSGVRLAAGMAHVPTTEPGRTKAGDLVRVASKVLKGGGGGKPDIAQGGGTDPLAIPDALQEIVRMVAQTVNQ